MILQLTSMSKQDEICRDLSLRWISYKYSLLQQPPGGWFNKKMSSYQYRKSHCGDKTILRPSYLHNGISYTGKTTFLYWIRALMRNAWWIIHQDLFISLQWRHNECGGVSNRQRLDCLLNCLFRHRSKKTSKLRFTGLYEGNSLVTDEFPAQRASIGDNVPIWWCHHIMAWCLVGLKPLGTWLLLILL